jgi:phosphoglycolate phosphatase
MSTHCALVIFDLDGTLVDAYPAIIRSFNDTMEELGYPRQKDSVIRRAVGWGDRGLLAPFVKPGDLSRGLALYRRRHARDLVRGTRTLPYAHWVLRLLKARGYRLAIASNRPTRFSRIILRHLGLMRNFNAVVCADKLSKAKPDPEILNYILNKFGLPPNRALYVGDMTIDVRTGKAAHVPTVVVTTGSSSKRQIAKERPLRIIASLQALPGIVSALR